MRNCNVLHPETMLSSLLGIYFLCNVLSRMKCCLVFQLYTLCSVSFTKKQGTKCSFYLLKFHFKEKKRLYIALLGINLYLFFMTWSVTVLVFKMNVFDSPS